jgi:Domain of unknown function (DUF4442)
MTTQLHAFWKSANALPVIGGLFGKRIFSLVYSFKAPYFGSFAPRVVDMRPNYGEVVVPNRWRNRNHIGTVHAIAVCNGLEMAMGSLAEATVPDDKRWLPKPSRRTGTATTGTCRCASGASSPTGPWWSRAPSTCGSHRRRSDRSDAPRRVRPTGHPSDLSV